MRLLLAGASGFLGRHALLAAPEGWDVAALHRRPDFPAWLESSRRPAARPIRCNLEDAEDVARQLGGEPRFDAALFLAGNSNIAASVASPEQDVTTTLMSLLNLLRHVHVDRWVFLSSGTVYLGSRGPVGPDQAVAPLVPYGITKLASELYVRAMAQAAERVSSFVNLRFFGAYGPYEPGWKIYGRLIRHFVIDGRRDFTLSGDGQNLIDAMYATDAGAGLWAAITGEARDVTVDFCAGARRTLAQLVRDVASTLGVGPIDVRFEGATAEPIAFYASPDPMAELFGFRPSVSLEEGILRFRDWIIQEAR